jgi:hypothetical protein
MNNQEFIKSLSKEQYNFLTYHYTLINDGDEE